MDIEMLYSDWLKLTENFDKSIYSRKNGSFGVNSERLKSSHPSSIKGTKCTDQPMYTLSGFQCWSYDFFDYKKIAISSNKTKFIACSVCPSFYRSELIHVFNETFQ